MHHRRFIAISLFSILSLLISAQVWAQDDVVKKRKAFMDENYDELKAIKKAVEQKDYATVQLKAKDIMDNMDKLVDYFPKGSLSEKSRAKPEIWDKWDEFKTLAVKVKDVAGNLAKAAAAKNEPGVQTQFKALGSESPFRSGACYECHKDFRNNPPPVKKSEG